MLTASRGGRTAGFRRTPEGRARGTGTRCPLARGRSDSRTDRRPLVDRIADVITDDRLEVGAAFLSASELCARFGVSRPTVRRALDKLEAAGLLTEGGQGKLRTVRALPNR